MTTPFDASSSPFHAPPHAPPALRVHAPNSAPRILGPLLVFNRRPDATEVGGARMLGLPRRAKSDKNSGPSQRGGGGGAERSSEGGGSHRRGIIRALYSEEWRSSHSWPFSTILRSMHIFFFFLRWF